MDEDWLPQTAVTGAALTAEDVTTTAVVTGAVTAVVTATVTVADVTAQAFETASISAFTDADMTSPFSVSDGYTNLVTAALTAADATASLTDVLTAPLTGMTAPPPSPAAPPVEAAPVIVKAPVPLPTPGTTCDVGFLGLFFSTFFGGHTADWASPRDQHTYFREFKMRINA